jgi:hypothetical protein
MRALLTRRAFLARAGAAIGALSVPAFARARTHGTSAIYKLSPWGVACRACQAHDKNKLFPTRKAALGNRAHNGCNCGPRKGSIDSRGYGLLFGSLTRAQSIYTVDRRDSRVAAILAKYPVSFP